MTLDWKAYRTVADGDAEPDYPVRESRPPGSTGSWGRLLLGIAIFVATVWLTSIASR
jgi:hypothetical protein